MAQVFNIISAFYLWGCMFTSNPSWHLSLLSTYTANRPFWPVPHRWWCLCANNPNRPHPTLKTRANIPRNGWMGNHHGVSFTWAVLLLHSSFCFFTRTHTWIPCYRGSKISVCSESMSHERKYWKMLRLVSVHQSKLSYIPASIRCQFSWS